jgi:hypothetical protein
MTLLIAVKIKYYMDMLTWKHKHDYCTHIPYQTIRKGLSFIDRYNSDSYRVYLFYIFFLRSKVTQQADTEKLLRMWHIAI